MARPYNTRPTVRVQTEGPPQAPSLGVFAPLDVRTPGPETSGLQGLIQSLGIVTAVGAQAKKERDDFNFKQGVADEQLGDADLLKAKKSRAYADGAFQTATIEQYYEAEQKVSERAAGDDLDKSLPIEDQVRIVDGWMKSELGPMVADPRAKVLIGERYQKFIDSFSGAVLKGQVEAHAKAAQDVLLQDATAQLDKTGSFNYDELFHRGYSQTGDASQTNELLLGVIAQHIEDAAQKGEPYEQFRALIPTESIGPNGQKIPGPMYNPKYRGIINQALANAEKLHDKFYETKYSTASYKALVDLDSQVRAGSPVTMDSIAAAGYTVGDKPEDTLSVAQARSLIDQSAAVQAKMASQDADYQKAVGLHKMFARWADVEHLGGMTPEKTADAADRQLQTALLGSGFKEEDLAGIGMAANAPLISAVATWSAAEGVPYRPLKDTMSSINQAAPGDLHGRLEAYKTLKARGLTGMYVDDDASALYEKALDGQRIGLDKEKMDEFIRTSGDKDIAAYISDNMRDVKVRTKGVNLSTGRGLLSLDAASVNSMTAVNAPYLAGKYESLVRASLALNRTRADAEAFAKDRIEQTHTALKIGDKWAFLPSQEVGNPQDAQSALDWYETQLPALKKAAKVPDDEPVSIVPRVSLNGRQMTLEVQRAGGTPIQSGTVTLQGLVSTYLRLHPQETGQSRAAREQKRRRELPAQMGAAGFESRRPMLNRTN